MSALENVRPADTQAIFQSASDMAEKLVIHWITADAPKQDDLRKLVIQWNSLERLGDHEDEQNAVYDRLLVVATRYLAQLRKAQHRPARHERRLERQIQLFGSFQEKCDLAIAKWRAAR